MKKPKRKKIKQVTRKLVQISGIPITLSRLMFKDKRNWRNIEALLAATNLYSVSVSEAPSSDSGRTKITIDFVADGGMWYPPAGFNRGTRIKTDIMEVTHAV